MLWRFRFELERSAKGLARVIAFTLASAIRPLRLDMLAIRGKLSSMQW